MNADRDARTEDPASDGRLAAVASLVSPGSRVADIGTGHGLLPHRLLASGRCPHCFATERTSLLLREVRLHPASHRFAGSLHLRSGDGLEALRPDDQVETVVLAGMGGATILGILGRSPRPCSTFRRLVFQPQTEPARLRRGLIEQGLSIVAECLVLERGRFYLALAAEPALEATIPIWPGLEPAEVLEAGPCLLRDAAPLLVPFWRAQADRLERILERAGSGSGRRAVRKRLELARRVLLATAENR